jgi:hypothetical protein
LARVDRWLRAALSITGGLPPARYVSINIEATRAFSQLSVQASNLSGADAAALFTQIARGIDKWLWFVETGQQSDV